MRLDRYSLKLLGYIGVDAGIVWIGDPCYIDSNDTPPFANWNEFCNKLYDGQPSFNAKEFSEGVCVSTLHGDGRYPIYALQDNRGNNRLVLIDFNNEFGDDDA